MGHNVQGGLRKPRFPGEGKIRGGEEHDSDLQLLKGQEGIRLVSDMCS